MTHAPPAGPPHGDDGRDGHEPGLIGSPMLAELLDRLAVADRAQAEAVQLLARLYATGEVEATTGTAVETWLLARGLPGSDRRMLATAVTQLGRLPAVAEGFASGRVSWGQVRTICLLAERLNADQAAELDGRLAGPIDRWAKADPDGLLALARQIVDRLRTAEVAAETAESGLSSFIALQPQLDGNGGRLHGQLDGLGFGIVAAALSAAALSAGAPLPGRRRDLIGQPAAREDREDDGWERTRRLGRHRAARLVQLAANDLARRGTPWQHGEPLAADDADTSDELDRTRALVPDVLLLLDQDQLTGADRLPVELLSKLTGGRLKVSAPTAARWLDEAGARLRTIVLDETGQVLGVGRRTRFEPGWLTDVRVATDATCRAPGCRTAATVCDGDHHTPWHPTSPDQPPGTTDVANLGSLCTTDNTAKHRQGWKVDQRPDGTVDWSHPRSGLQVRTVPWSTLRAAARRPAQARGRSPDRRPDPPPPRGTGPPRTEPPLPTSHDPPDDDLPF